MTRIHSDSVTSRARVVRAPRRTGAPAGVPLIRASHLRPFTVAMDEIGAPVERLLRSVRLPTLARDDPSAAVPEAFVWALCGLVARREGVADYGARAAESCPPWSSEPAVVAALSQQPTVLTGLRRFCEVARHVSTGPGYRCDRLGGRVVLRHLNWAGIDGQDQVDLYTVVLMTQVVECTLGRHWQPPEILVRPANVPILATMERFSSSRVQVSHTFTGIVVPDELLAQPVAASRRRLGAGELPPALGDDLLGSMRLALRAYLAEARPSGSLAAEIAGLSERTFQRRLSELSLNYSTLLDQVRFEEARERLAEPATTVTEIAYDLGFTDVAHFTRAFRRWTDMSPRQYRRQVTLASVC